MILKKTLLLFMALCIVVTVGACGKKEKTQATNKEQTSQTDTSKNESTKDNSKTNEENQTDKSKPIENTEVTEQEFEDLVAQANSDDEEVKKAALEKLQVILDQVESNSPSASTSN